IMPVIKKRIFASHIKTLDIKQRISMTFIIAHWRFCFFFAEKNKENSVNQSEDELVDFEGNAIIIKCNYTATDPFPYLYWYVQYVNEAPQYLLRRDRNSEDNAPRFKDRFSATLDNEKKTVPLLINNAQIFDSAVYYCALRP
uniref:Ig-like domain-containing protein n=1 Tax=Latimeria chalumnae TaxID=7897 RepID=H3ARA4_LATCH